MVASALLLGNTDLLPVCLSNLRCDVGKQLYVKCVYKSCNQKFLKNDSSTMVDNSQEYRLKYWATRSSIHSFARTAHSFACSALLVTLARSIRSLAHSLVPELVGH